MNTIKFTYSTIKQYGNVAEITQLGSMYMLWDGGIIIDQAATLKSALYLMERHHLPMLYPSECANLIARAV